MAGTLVLKDQSTAPMAWLAAVEALDASSKQAYNLVYTVTNPSSLTDVDRKIIALFNAYALNNGLHTTDTVANTIFPLDTYRSKGNGMYEYYLSYVFPKVRKFWGTYFERMIRRRNDVGTIMMKDGVPLNPLERLVEKVGRRIDGIGKTTTHYELSLDDPILDLATYDPHHDGSYQIGGPCLSHLSFKVDNKGVLRLTAFYRSHWYIARALGNLIGLARLQAFVASQTKATVGPLTIVASEAILDLSASGRSASSTREMLKSCQAVV